MGTKSKGTKSGRIDLFKGLVSWLFMLLTLCAVPIFMALLIIALVNPGTLMQMGHSVLEVGSITEEEALGIALWVLCAAALCSVVLVPIFLFRKDRLALTSMIAKGLSKVWVEIKLLALILDAACVFSLLGGYMDQFIVAVILVILTAYFLCLDIGYNRQFFRHNMIRSILRRCNDYRNLPTFERRALRRLYSCLGVIACVILISLFTLLWMSFDDYWLYGGVLGKMLLPGVLIFSIVAVVGTIAWYVLSLKQDLRDWNVLMAQISEMYGGNLDAMNHVPPTSNLYLCAMQLNMIRTGIQKAVDEGVRADRTKVELITNVSHDIKTPLTSIISYIELLKKEPDLPPHVMDYINTISSKADRLSHIVQDVFDVSKAATGNINLDLEDLDIGKLLQQTFVEMSEAVEASPLIWKLDIPETPVLVHVDGQRIYRVFQNLIRNCIQYSLEGSRAYVTLTVKEGMAQVIVRNVSKNEITMDGEDLTARFVRGDQNRTTEGSGLGLSIAKSFTEACGGRFVVHTDGDLFTVTVCFPQVKKSTHVPYGEPDIPAGQPQPSAVPSASPIAETPCAPPPAEPEKPAPTPEQAGNP